MEKKQPLQVGEIIAVMIDQLAAIAWSKLGLQPDLASGEIATDLPQARLAIDAVDRLCELLRPELDSEDQRRLTNLVNDLRINFLDRQKGASPS